MSDAQRSTMFEIDFYSWKSKQTVYGLIRALGNSLWRYDAQPHGNDAGAFWRHSSQLVLRFYCSGTATDSDRSVVRKMKNEIAVEAEDARSSLGILHLP